MDWKLSQSHTERYALDADAAALRAHAHGAAKHERVVLQYVMVKDCADGSHRILDLVLILGNDKKAKVPTARLVITTGKHASLKHDGDYNVNARDVMSYRPVCSLHIRAEHERDAPSPARSGKRGHGRVNRQAEAMVKVVMERLVNRAHKKNLWLATMAKRNLALSLSGLIPKMKYYRLRDNWRVPQDKLDSYREAMRKRSEFKRAAAWAFEEVKTAPEVL